MTMKDEIVEKVARAIMPEAWAVLDNGKRDLIKHQVNRASSLRYARAAIASHDSAMGERVRELEAEVERLTPRYAQPCFNHEYITSGCPDCGKLA